MQSLSAPPSDVCDLRARLCAWLRNSAPASGDVPTDVIDAARKEDVHLLLGDRLQLLELAQDLRGSVIVTLAREREMRRLLPHLGRVGVRPVLIKGASLAYTSYPLPELRPRADTDLMIPIESRERVAALLGQSGYERLLGVDGDLTTGQFHFLKRDLTGVNHALDVHWRLSNVRVFADVLDYADLARDAQPVAALGENAWAPSTVHALFIACVHRVAHHADTPSLLWLYDIHLLAQALTAEERAAFLDLASARQMRAVCARGLRLAQEAFGGIDAGFINSLATPSGPTEPSARFIGARLRPVDILLADLSATPGWRARLGILRERLFPRASFMYGRYQTRRRIALPFLYLHRAVSGIPKWFQR